ncbi:MAG TPA: hypothetical protein PK874_01270 [Desulfobacteraceae bacterium]|nr:hypothetical protein [Desulfobacteraceae bacterium]HPJ66556.1 hypothetical protein [Desulfobacteraceae bacterium]HPQ27478.1 hypothetical protein [Desulfobacteraceae bacterium]
MYRRIIVSVAILLWGIGIISNTPLLCAKVRTCPPFYLKNDSGEIINPIKGQNADQPYSTRQTCGACHDYDKITKGYHFQQGWDRIRDDFNKEKPWVLSDGMMGKH